MHLIQEEIKQNGKENKISKYLLKIGYQNADGRIFNDRLSLEVVILADWPGLRPRHGIGPGRICSTLLRTNIFMAQSSPVLKL